MFASRSVSNCAIVLTIAVTSLSLIGCKTEERQMPSGASAAGSTAALPVPASAVSAPPASITPAGTQTAEPAPSGSGVTHPLSLRERLDIGEFTAPPHPPPDKVKVIGLAQIVIAYKGAKNAPARVQRSKGEASSLAEQVGRLVRAGADFGEMALKYSDDPSVKDNRGNLGKVTREQLDRPVADAAFALMVMEVAGEPVETATGFHIVRRTE